MQYWDIDEEHKQKGIDWDLSSCLEYNPQDFSVSDIVKVHAVWEGEHDGDGWRWVIEVNNCEKQFVFLCGWCDYTGWDCQSGATSVFANTANEAVELAKLAKSTEYDCYNNLDDVYESLVKQLESEKAKTWYEKKDDELKAL